MITSKATLLTLMLIFAFISTLPITYAQTEPPVRYPETINVYPFWQYLNEGNLLGFFNAIFLWNFLLEDILIGVIIMLFLGPLYIRTKSLLLICIIWMLLGGFLISAAPALSGLAIVFLIFGVGGTLWKLVRPT